MPSCVFTCLTNKSLRMPGGARSFTSCPHLAITFQPIPHLIRTLPYYIATPALKRPPEEKKFSQVESLAIRRVHHWRIFKDSISTHGGNQYPLAFVVIGITFILRVTRTRWMNTDVHTWALECAIFLLRLGLPSLGFLSSSTPSSNGGDASGAVMAQLG
jgi:hypothetical protein